MAGIKIDALGAEIAKMMEEYAAEVASDVKAEAKVVAKEAVKELKSKSPEDRNSKKMHYKDGWASKVESENAVSIGIRVYNRKKPGLTHLWKKAMRNEVADVWKESRTFQRPRRMPLKLMRNA